MDGECYARRQHVFSDDLEPKRRKTFSDLMKRESRTDSQPSPTSPPVRFTIDARIPNPPILTCGAPVPLRVLITQHNPRRNPLYLQTLQIEIVGFTAIRAGNENQSKSTSWVIVSVSNLKLAIGNVGDAVGTTSEIDNTFWSNYRLPDSICPSFATCNLRRSYELVATLGLTYGSTQPGLVSVPSNSQCNASRLTDFILGSIHLSSFTPQSRHFQWHSSTSGTSSKTS
jgi:hypothetical protein